MTREEALFDALVDATASLAGAASAYRSHASRHRSVGRATADPFFTTRASDFDKAVERARAVLLAPSVVSQKDAVSIMAELDEDRRLFVKYQHMSARELMMHADTLGKALEGMLAEWDQLTRYGSPLAKAANERVQFARGALAALPSDNGKDEA
jgi:hypothetical protein